MSSTKAPILTCASRRLRHGPGLRGTRFLGWEFHLKMSRFRARQRSGCPMGCSELDLNKTMAKQLGNRQLDGSFCSTFSQTATLFPCSPIVGIAWIFAHHLMRRPGSETTSESCTSLRTFERTHYWLSCSDCGRQLAKLYYCWARLWMDHRELNSRES